MFSVYGQERDAEGREVIGIGLNENRAKAALVAAPVVFVLAMYFIMHMPLAMVAFGLVLFPVIFAGVGFRFVGLIARQAALRVTLDGKAGRILVASASGQSEIRMADVARAEFGSSISASTDSNNNTSETTVYRLEFVKKNGERVPATSARSNVYSLAHRERMVAAINAALHQWMP